MHIKLLFNYLISKISKIFLFNNFFIMIEKKKNKKNSLTQYVENISLISGVYK